MDFLTYGGAGFGYGVQIIQGGWSLPHRFADGRMRYGGLPVVVIHCLFQRSLGGAAGGVFDVRGGEAVGAFRQELHVHGVHHGRGDEAMPHGLAGMPVGKSDGDDAVEPAVAEEGCVERADEVGGA